MLCASVRNGCKLNQPFFIKCVLNGQGDVYSSFNCIVLKTRTKFIAGLLLVFLYGNISMAVTITATANGNWGATGTWSLGRKPTCGDTIVIPASITVTVNAQENLVPCVTPVVLIVNGTLQFTNGNKIDFSCGSWVFVSSTGIIKKATSGGGNSTLISICGYIEWNAGDGILNGVDTLGGHGSLPVTWLTIDASLDGKNVKVSWSTAVEVNNDYFDVMRSDDGVIFKGIGKINGSGNSTSTTFYLFTDVDPQAGVSYYRLKQVDYDGTEDFSHPVAIYNPSGSIGIDEVKVLPNPFSEEAKIIFNAKQNYAATAEIKNMGGQTCMRQSLNAVKGMNTISLDRIATLTKGVYTLTITNISGSSRPYGLIKK